MVKSLLLQPHTVNSLSFFTDLYSCGILSDGSASLLFCTACRYTLTYEWLGYDITQLIHDILHKFAVDYWCQLLSLLLQNKIGKVCFLEYTEVPDVLMLHHGCWCQQRNEGIKSDTGV
jgi:hypothetical protein